jgi:hypothetical protein
MIWTLLYKSERSVRTWTSVQSTGTFPTSFYILSLVQCMWELWWTKWYWDRLFSEHFHSSAISCSVDCYFITDVSGQPIGPIVKSQGSGTAWPLKPYHFYSQTMTCADQQIESPVVKILKVNSRWHFVELRCYNLSIVLNEDDTLKFETSWICV